MKKFIIEKLQTKGLSIMIKKKEERQDTSGLSEKLKWMRNIIKMH